MRNAFCICLVPFERRKTNLKMVKMYILHRTKIQKLNGMKMKMKSKESLDMPSSACSICFHFFSFFFCWMFCYVSFCFVSFALLVHWLAPHLENILICLIGFSFVSYYFINLFHSLCIGFCSAMRTSHGWDNRHLKSF